MKRVCFVSQVAASLIVLCGSTILAQQNPNGVIPLHTTNQPFLFLVRDPVVHREANLTEEQLVKLKALNDRVDLDLWSMRNKSAEQMIKIMESATKETQAAMVKFLEKDQRKRIRQIEFWVLGEKSILLDNVAKYLKATPEELSEVRQIIVDAEKKLAGLKEELQAGGDLKALNEQWADIKHQQRKDALDVLSEEQRQRFRAMLGKQVELGQLGRIRMKVPDFVTNSKWVNSEPLTLEKLKGKVVALHFYAFA